MKLSILDKDGNKVKEIETKLFEEPIREDIIRKVVEAKKTKHPYSPKNYAGMDSSASGNVRHKRHSWKSDRGKGLSRIPRKAFWRRGTQFSWQGAIVPFARGGRRAHPPTGIYRVKKINKKEFKKALLSCLSYVSDIRELKNKYSSLRDKKLELKLPLILDDSILKLKNKEFFTSLKKILNDFYDIAIQKKSVRGGVGKRRGRKYKKNAGLLFVIGKNEDKNINGIEFVKANKLTLKDLAENGARLTLFSENSIKDIEGVLINDKYN